jgi:phosphoinositide-3-kinase regulatory subunit 4
MVMIVYCSFLYVTLKHGFLWQEVPGVESGSHTSSKSKTSLATAATDSAGCHQDCILGLASAQTNQRLLISSSRDGALKVWK